MQDRIHRAISADGTEIAGRVQGQGPPLVLVHGAFEDGDTCWGALLPFVSERYTCYAMSLRSRGLSGRSADLSPQRLVEDVTAFVDSIGEPACLLGESGGGFLALGAAAHTDAVSALAVYEPVVFEVQSEQVAAGFRDTVARAGNTAAAGRSTDAVRIFAEWLANDDELAALSAADDAVAALAANAPVQLREFRQTIESAGPSPTDPSVLARVTAPVLILHGSRTALRPWFTDGVRHVAEHVADAQVREIAGGGHFAVALAPELIAGELVPFFETARQPA